MGFFDFLKKTEQAVGRFAGGAVKQASNLKQDFSSGWNFLKNNPDEAFKAAGNVYKGVENKAIQTFTGLPADKVTPVTNKFGGAVAGLARQTVVNPALNVLKSAQQTSETRATAALSDTLDQLKALPYDQRKAALNTPNNGLKLILNNHGITDPTDENLAKALEIRKSAQEKTTQPFQPKGELQKAVLGNEPVKSYQQRYQGLKETGFSTPAAVLGMGANIGLDVVPGGGEEGKVIKNVAKATTETGVRKLLSDKVAPEVLDRIAPALTRTTDKKVTQRILKANGVDLSGTQRVIARAPTESKELSDQVRRGNLESTGSTVPIDTLKLGGGTQGSRLDKKTVGAYVKDIQAGKTIDPLVIDQNGLVQDGKHRLAAMQQLGVKDVPVVRQTATDVSRPPSILPASSVTTAAAKTTGKDPLIQEYAGILKQAESGGRGGQLIPGAEGGYARATSHTPFYSQFYKENGRPPSGADWYAEAEKQIKTGKADPEFIKYYNQQNSPEFKSLAASAEKDTAPTSKGDVFPVDTSKPPSTIPNPNIPTGEKQFGTYESAQRATGLTDKTKKDIAAIEPQTHDIRSTSDLGARMEAEVKKDPEAVNQKIHTVGEGAYTDEEKIAASNKLLEHYSQLGTEEGTNKAVKLAQDLAQNNLGLGRAVQANQVIERLSPAGATKFAEKTLRKAGEATGKTEKVAGVAGDLQKRLEKVSTVKEGDVQKAVKAVSKGDQAEKSVGEKVAGRIEQTVTPKVKQQADQLVDELTKKIKQESLAPKTLERKSPTEVLQEVFGRHAEAKAAYPEAQRILREKFADNPNALKTLDKFFESKLGLPAASTTVDRAIREQLGKDGKQISKIIHESWINQKQSVDDVAKALVSHGFDENSSKILAKEVTDRLNKQVATAKIKELERMKHIFGAPTIAKKTYAEKVVKLSNVGALDNKDYLDLARGKLKIPNLTEKTASDVSKLAQEMQKFKEGDPERYLIAQKIGNRIQDDIPRTAKQTLREIAGAPRAILASTDISGMGRQGIFLGSKYAHEYKQSFKKQVKYLANDEAFKKDMATIATDKDYDLIANKMGVALTGVSKKPEEVFSSTIAEGKLAKKLGVGHVIEGSDRGYTGALTDFRYNVAKRILKDLGPERVSKLSDKELQSLGEFINVGSGRGGKIGGYLDKHGATLSQALFSPRLWASRLQPLNPKYYYDLKGPARKLALENAGQFAAVAGAVFGLAAMAGASVETDARSSDFLKIKVGSTRFDVLGGFQQNLVFAWREISGEKKSSQSGQVTKLGTQWGGADRLSILSDLVHNKENPVIATGQRIIQGKDRSGQPTNIAKEVGGLFVPLSIQSVATGIQHYGAGKGVASALPEFVGVGSQTYGLKDIRVTGKQDRYLSELKKKGVPKEQYNATKEFFQTIKTVPTTDDTMAKIKDALKAGDTQKVTDLANSYNKQYSSAFKGWAQKYGSSYGNNKDLVSLYNRGKIDDATITRAADKLKKDQEDAKKGVVRL